MPTHKGDLTVLNVGQLAALVKCKAHVMRRKLDGLKPVATSGRELLYDSAAALQRYYLGESISLTTERARLARAQSTAVKRRNERESGE